MEAAIATGDLNIAQWATKMTSGTLKSSAIQQYLAMAVCSGQNDTAAWLLDTYSSLDCNQVFQHAAKNGRTAMCALLHEKRGVRDDCVANSLMCAIENGHTKTGEWIVSRFNFDAYMIGICLRSIQFSHFHLFELPLVQLKWLHSSLKLQRFHIIRDDLSVFVNAASVGDIRCCKWLHQTFSLAAADVRRSNDTALEEAAANGYIELCEWYLSEFMPPNDVTQETHTVCCELLRIAAANGHVHLCRWLHDKYHFSKSDFQRCDGMDSPSE